METKGKVVYWNEERNFGFVKLSEEPHEEYFFHFNECVDEVKHGDNITCDLVKSRNKPGKLIAVNVKIQE